MARDKTKNTRPAGRVVDLLLDGKKTVLASALVLVMAFMWIRVLTGRKPGSAGAAPEQKQTAPAKQQEPARVRMIEVPKTPGRHDAIGRDCFNMQKGTHFWQIAAAQNTSADTEVQVVPPNRDQEVVQQVAQTLKLGAVLRKDNSPRAFMNDRWLAVGDTFPVEHGTGSLEFEVLRIHDDSVLVTCKGIQLTLKLAQSMEVRK